MATTTASYSRFNAIVFTRLQSEGMTIDSAAELELDAAIARAMGRLKSEEAIDRAEEVLEKMVDSAISFARRRGSLVVDLHSIAEVKRRSPLCPNIFC